MGLILNITQKKAIHFLSLFPYFLHLKSIFKNYMYGQVFISAPHVCLIASETIRECHSLELEPQMVVSCQVGAEKQVLWKSTPCSQLSHLSGPWETDMQSDKCRWRSDKFQESNFLTHGILGIKLVVLVANTIHWAISPVPSALPPFLRQGFIMWACLACNSLWIMLVLNSNKRSACLSP